jgi:ubiquinone/menaquinone biosynthesis C-methylase UbiE
MQVVFIVSVMLNIFLVVFLLFRSRAGGRSYGSVTSPADVAKFYDRQTGNFLKVYGQVIQAFRTKNVDIMLKHQIDEMGLKPGLKVLDAGCGVCGPAIFFSQNAGVRIDAITVSGEQVKLARENTEKSGAPGITVREGDYHHLEKYYDKSHFDVIYFLESFGHASDHLRVLDSAWQVLKPGGLVYIKDLFIKKAIYKAMEKGIRKEIRNINSAYRYNVPDLNKVLDHARKKGYILSSLKTIDIPLEEFENLTISNDFQELTGINKIGNLRDYVFPVDFFELRLLKPVIDASTGTSRYFLQNLYLTQVEKWKDSNL